MGVIYWYSDTQTNWDYSLVLWYPNQWGLFIGILIPKPMGVVHCYSDTQSMGVIHWYSDTQPMGVIYWYSDIQTNGGYSLVLRCPVTGIQRDHCHKIIKNMNYVWTFELFWVLKTTYVILKMFEYLNYFESLKSLM